jgi:hypothetical protein
VASDREPGSRAARKASAESRKGAVSTVPGREANNPGTISPSQVTPRTGIDNSLRSKPRACWISSWIGGTPTTLVRADLGGRSRKPSSDQSFIPAPIAPH